MVSLGLSEGECGSVNCVVCFHPGFAALAEVFLELVAILAKVVEKASGSGRVVQTTTCAETSGELRDILQVRCERLPLAAVISRVRVELHLEFSLNSSRSAIRDAISSKAG